MGFTCPVHRTKGSARAFPYRRKDGRLGVRVTSANPIMRHDQQRIAWAARDAMIAARLPMFVGPVAVRIDVYLARPASASRALPSVKPDLDKLVRLVLDALAWVAFADDATVCRLMPASGTRQASSAPTSASRSARTYEPDGPAPLLRDPRLHSPRVERSLPRARRRSTRASGLCLHRQLPLLGGMASVSRALVGNASVLRRVRATC